MAAQPFDLRPILSKLIRTENDSRPVVVMTCGIAGAGKSNLAKEIVGHFSGFIRLSIDGVNFKRNGLYAIDYANEKYEEHQTEAMEILVNELQRRLKDGTTDIVLDLSFWNKKYRDDFKAIIESNGGRWVLVLLDADRELLWQRITSRKAQRDEQPVGDRNGDSAFDIDEETFDSYCKGFERPREEGECVINVA